jgi:Fe-S oxidoreductase
MLTLPEKILFVIAVILALYAAYRAGNRIVRTIRRGRGQVDWEAVKEQFVKGMLNFLTFRPVFRLRFWPSLFHGFIGWAFIYYLLVNLIDVIRGFVSGFEIPGTVGGVYRLVADLISVLALVGIVYMVIRRFLARTPQLTAREEILLSPKARAGIRRDSAIVAGFIFVHIGSRFLGEAVQVAMSGAPDPWMPFASLAAELFSGMSPTTQVVFEHIFFWGGLGTILAFIPYFLYSKHLHLIFTPLNFMFKPRRRSMGELEKLDFEDESLEQFGASKLEDLGWEQIMDAYACIMCYRCQQVCPAYNTGKVLSPAALEINKRYYLNAEGGRLARGEPSALNLTEFAITPEAVWACTACGACIDICPVGNEPMRDILDIRRGLVLMENEFPKQLQTAFRGMERTVNPWNLPQSERMKWAEGCDVPTIEQNPEPELLWWVGCAPATDARAQKTAQAFAEILNSAGVNYAVLGQNEQCTGDSARRAGKEDLFYELASANVELLNEVAPKRIVTTCPHCLHTIKNEYPAFGGSYEVVHHTQLINELVGAGKIRLQEDSLGKLTYHDPCYLGRQNGILEAPRSVLQGASKDFVELPRHGRQSFCCGAGGAQMWKEEEEGDERVSTARFKEAQAAGAGTLAVGCPFCMVMLNDAKKDAGSEMQVLDVAEIVAAQIKR